MIQRFLTNRAGGFRSMFAVSFAGLAAIGYFTVDRLSPLPLEAVNFTQTVANTWGWQ
jgi:hypothetical protein